jgi:hypothetical protein
MLFINVYISNVKVYIQNLFFVNYPFWFIDLEFLFQRLVTRSGHEMI